MAVTRFDQPAQAQYIQTYVPLPTDDIWKSYEAQQQRHDTNLASIEQSIADVEAMKAMPGADTEYVNYVANQMRDISSKYSTQDYMNPEIIRDMMRELNARGINRADLNKIQQSYKGYESYLQEEAKLKAAGKYAPELRYDFEGYSTLDPSMGIFTGTPEALLNSEQALREAFANIGDEILDDRAIGDSGRRATIIGKDINKLQQHIVDNYDRLSTDPRVSQLLRRMGVDPNNRQSGMEVLLREAPKYIDEKPSFYMDPLYKGKSGQSKSRELTTSLSEGINTQVSIPIDNFDIDKIEINKDGKIERKEATKLGHALKNFFKLSIDPEGKDVRESFSFTQKDVMDYADKNGTSLIEAKRALMKQQGNLDQYLPKSYEEYKKLNENQQRNLELLIDNYPSLQDIPVEEALEQIKQARDDLQNTSISLSSMSNLANQDLLDDIVNNKRHRNFMIMDGEGISSKSLHGKGGVLDELGMEEEEFDSYLRSSGVQLGGFTQDGPEPGMFYIEIPSKKGKEMNRRVLISSDENIRNTTSGSYLVNQLITSMSKGLARPGLIDNETRKEIAYFVDTDIHNGTFIPTIYAGYVENGNFRPFRETNITEIKQLEREALMNSGYLGTEFGRIAPNKVR